MSDAERFTAVQMKPDSRIWRVLDTTGALPPWVFGDYGAFLNEKHAEQAAETLNRGCRAEREDECVS